MARHYGLHDHAYARRYSAHRNKTAFYRIKIVFCTVIAFAVAVAVMALISVLFAKDDGRYAGSPLKPWFDQLASKKGLCCSFADGRSIADVDWGTQSIASGDETAVRYWVNVDGEHVVVPPEAVITEPNKFGPAVVWPYKDAESKTQIRCFMPGAGA